MTTWQELREQARAGEMTGRLIADITALPRHRLDGWHRRGIARASVWRGDREMPRIYAWSDYARIRAAQQFLELGVRPRGLRCALDELDSTIDDWPRLLRRDHRGGEIVRCSGTSKYEIRLPAAKRELEVAEASAAPLGPLAVEVAGRLRDDGPLGRLRRFERWVDMRPEVQGGYPTLRDARVMTADIAGYARTGMSAAEIADTLQLDADEVAKALQFERELTARSG